MPKSYHSGKREKFTVTLEEMKKLSNIQLSERRRARHSKLQVTGLQYGEKSMQGCISRRAVYWQGVYVLCVTGSLTKPAIKYQIQLAFVFFCFRLKNMSVFSTCL